MAEDIGSLVVRIEARLGNFENGMQQVSNKIDGFSSKMQKIGAIVAGSFVVSKVTDFARESIKLASDLTEVQNVVDIVFGTANKKVNEFATSAATKFGLSELSAKKFTSTMGAMLDSMGLTDKQVLDMSTSLTGLSGDMASFYNLDPQQAFDKLRAGISGETEPLKQLGINMSVANLEAFALTKGIKTTYEHMSQAEQTTLRYNYIMTATAKAQGDFAKTQGSYANQQRIFTMQMDTLRAGIGERLLPAMTSFITYLNSHVTDIEKFAQNGITKLTNAIKFLKDNANILIPIISGLTAAIAAQAIIGTITRLYNTWKAATTTMTTAQWLLNSAMAANPFGVVAVAIGALVAAGVALYKNWDKVKIKAIELMNFLSTKFSEAFNIGRNLIQGLINGMASMISVIGNKVKEIGGNVISTFKNILGIHSPSKIMAEIGKFIDMGLADGIEANASKVTEKARRMADATISIFNKMGDAITTALKSKYKLQQDMFLQNLDADTQAKIAEVQLQIDAMDNLTNAEEKAIKEQEYQKRLAAIDEKVKTAKDAEEITSLQQEKNDMITEHERQALLEQRDNTKKALEQRIRDIQDQANKEREAKNKHFEQLMSEESLQAEARKLIVSKNNNEIIALLGTYNPQWLNAGQSFGESLINGLNSKKVSIQNAVDSILSLTNTPTNMFASLAKGAFAMASGVISQTIPTLGTSNSSNMLSTIAKNAFTMASGVVNQTVPKINTTPGNITNNFNINGMTVRNDNDVKMLAKEFYNLTASRNKGLGVVAIP